MSELKMRIPDLLMSEENLKAVNRLEKHGTLTKVQAESARILFRNCIGLYLSALTGEVEGLRAELGRQMTEANKAAKAATEKAKESERHLSVVPIERSEPASEEIHEKDSVRG